MGERMEKKIRAEILSKENRPQQNCKGTPKIRLVRSYGTGRVMTIVENCLVNEYYYYSSSTSGMSKFGTMPNAEFMLA